MKRFYQPVVCVIAFIVAFCLLVGPVQKVKAANPIGTACVFYSKKLDKFFLTANQAECDGINKGEIDAAPDGPKWYQIENFPVLVEELSGSKPVCRFVSNNGIDSTHTYALGDNSGKPLADRTDECAVIQKKWSDYWLLEDPAHFYADVPTGDVCPKVDSMQTVPVYRVWNQGRGGQNHFLTTNQDRFTQMNWWGTPEGVAWCASGAGTVYGELPKPGSGPGAPKSGGKIQIDSDSHLLTPDISGGMFFGISDKDGTYSFNPATVEKMCWNSHRVGWDKDSRACAPFNGTQAKVTKVCTNDSGNWSAWSAGKEYWVDLASPQAWSRSGLTSQVMPSGLVEYGQNGYHPSTVTAGKGKTGADLTIDFGSNCLTGFSKSFEAGDLMFLWNSDKAGNNGQSGWGLGNSTKMGFLNWSEVDQKFTVTFAGLACSDQGNITVYKPKSGTGQNVIWDGGADGFGYAWFAVPPKDEKNPQWLNNPNVTWEQTPGKEAIVFTVPGCTN